jgi:hypothetical protein
MTDDNKTFEPVDLQAGTPAPTPEAPAAPAPEAPAADIQITPPAAEAPAAAPEAAPAPELAPEVPAAAPELAAEAPVAAPELAPEALAAPAEGKTQPTSAILDGEPEGQKTADDGFFKKNKTMILGGVVALIVITVIVGIVLSIGNSDKLEGRLELLQNATTTNAETEAGSESATEELPMTEEPMKAPTFNPKTSSTNRVEPTTENYPNIVSLYAVK